VEVTFESKRPESAFPLRQQAAQAASGGSDVGRGAENPYLLFVAHHDIVDT
jgi:hypothetical protein